MRTLTCEEAPRPPFCLWRLLLQELPQWASSAQAHEDSMSLCDGHQRPVPNLQEVGLFLSPFLITQGSWEQSLGTSVRLDADPILEAVPPTTTYLPLLTYPRSIYL